LKLKNRNKKVKHKKQEDKVMKTRNSKLQNSELKSLTGVIVLIIVSVMNLQAYASEKSSRFNTVSSGYADMIATEAEATMNLENWMLNENYFYHAFEMEKATETILEIENWMTDATLFSKAVFLENEMEEALVVEEWMVNESNFFSAFVLETETELKLAEWMLKEISFFSAFGLDTEMEDTLELQAWMVSDSLFNSKPSEQKNTEALAMASEEKSGKVITIEYKDATTGNTFLFRLAEVEEPKLQLEYWMFDRKLWIRK
jgi:hypothetical protein